MPRFILNQNQQANGDCEAHNAPNGYSHMPAFPNQTTCVSVPHAMVLFLRQHVDIQISKLMAASTVALAVTQVNQKSPS